jgi:hypothetical protein
MSDIDLKPHVKGMVTFTSYSEGVLMYRTESGLDFPVPIADTGKAIFMAQDRAMLFMRWIRKHLETREKEKVSGSYTPTT